MNSEIVRLVPLSVAFYLLTVRLALGHSFVQWRLWRKHSLEDGSVHGSVVLRQQVNVVWPPCSSNGHSQRSISEFYDGIQGPVDRKTYLNQWKDHRCMESTWESKIYSEYIWLNTGKGSKFEKQKSKKSSHDSPHSIRSPISHVVPPPIVSLLTRPIFVPSNVPITCATPARRTDLLQYSWQ